MSNFERNSFNNFTRGGQFLNHFVRMAKDNLVRYVMISFFVTALFGWLKWDKIADEHDKYVMWNETTYVAILKVMPDVEKEVRLFRADGSEYVTDIKFRMNDDIYRQDFERAFALLKSAFWYGLIFGLLLLAIVMVAAAFIGKALGTDQHKRGARLESPKKVKKMLEQYNANQAKIMGLEDYEPYNLVGLPYPLRSETQHTMFVGSTGSGKTQAISDVVAQIKARGDRAVIYDKMRSFPERFYDPRVDVILNPLDKRCPPWDIFADARHLVDWENMAAAFIPDSGDGDSFWVSTARSVFANTARRIVIRSKENGIKPTITMLIQALIQTTDEELNEFLQGTIAASHINPENSRTTGSTRATLADAIRSLGYVRAPKPDEKGFSIREWIKDDSREGVVFLTSRDDIHRVLQPLLSMWITVFNSALMSQPRSSKRLIWFILDELPSLNRLPGLESVLAEARQYGAAYLLGLQLVSQLKDLYGDDKTDSIIGLTRNKLVFNPGDPNTAKVMSEFIGQKEVMRREHGITIGAESLRDGQSVSSRIAMEYIVLPEELSQLQGLHGVLAFTGDIPACRVVLEYLDLSGPQEGYIEDLEGMERAEAIFDKRQGGDLLLALRSKKQTALPQETSALEAPVTLPSQQTPPEAINAGPVEDADYADDEDVFTIEEEDDGTLPDVESMDEGPSVEGEAPSLPSETTTEPSMGFGRHFAKPEKDQDNGDNLSDETEDGDVPPEVQSGPDALKSSPELSGENDKLDVRGDEVHKDIKEIDARAEVKTVTQLENDREPTADAEEKARARHLLTPVSEIKPQKDRDMPSHFGGR